MALPVPQFTYQFNVNNLTNFGNNNPANARAILRGVKNALTGMALSPWVPISCSYLDDGAHPGPPGQKVAAGDFWFADSALVWGNNGSNHSWIVLQQPGLAGGTAQMCIDLNITTTEYQLSLIYSPSVGFTGGTVTNRPTAADSLTIRNAGGWGSPNGNFATRWHVMQSTNGRSTKVIYCRSAHCVAYWDFSDILNPNPSAWPLSSYGQIMANNFGEDTEIITYNTVMANSGQSRLPDVSFIALQFTTLGLNIGANGMMGQILTAADEVTGEWQATPAGLYTSTAGKRGYRGDAPDVWTTSDVVATGSTFPGDASRQFASFGRLIVPWNGTVPAVA